jgi:hypothetical protein
MLERFSEFLKDPNDQLSSKRLIGFWAAFHGTAFIWVFVALHTLSAELGLAAFMTMVCGAILGSTWDHK